MTENYSTYSAGIARPALWQRMQVGATQRAGLYEKLIVLLENNELLTDALQEMYEVYSDDGRRVTPMANMIYQCRQRVAEGSSFSEAIAPWVSPVEASILTAGEASGNLQEAFTDAIELVSGVSKIKWLIVGGTVYPFLLAGMIGFMLYIVSTQVVPSLAGVAPPETWGGTAAILYIVSEFTTKYGLLCAGAIALLVALSVASLPRLTGNLRYHLDRFPPWSLYRQIQGSTMLLTIGTLVKSGIKMHDALLLLRSHANRYMGERLDAIILGTTKGLNLGEALEAAEFRFPDLESIRFVRVLARRQGFDISLVRYARKYRETVIARVKVFMGIVFMLGLLCAGACAGLVVVSSTDIQDAIEASTQKL